MKYLNKETNGITLSRIGLGAMRMADVQQGVDTIHAALDSGITYLNTGDFYGHGESELERNRRKIFHSDGKDIGILHYRRTASLPDLCTHDGFSFFKTHHYGKTYICGPFL